MKNKAERARHRAYDMKIQIKYNQSCDING